MIPVLESLLLGMVLVLEPTVMRVATLSVLAATAALSSLMGLLQAYMLTLL